MSEPAQYRLLTFHVPKQIPVFLSLGRLFKESVKVRRHLWRFLRGLFFTVSSLPQAQPRSWRTIPYRPTATAYWICSQLPSICGGLLLHLQPEDTLCRLTRDSLNTGWYINTFDVYIGRTALGACSATWNFSQNSAFSRGQRIIRETSIEFLIRTTFRMHSDF
jgi:hypothetical protein